MYFTHQITHKSFGWNWILNILDLYWWLQIYCAHQLGLIWWFQIVLYTSNWVYPDEVKFYYSSIWIYAHNSKLHQVDFWWFQVKFDHQAGFILMLSNFTYTDDIKTTELIKLDLYCIFKLVYTNEVKFLLLINLDFCS